MKSLPTEIPGLMFFTLEDGQDFFTDERGSYEPFWNMEKLYALGLPKLEISQIADAKSKAGTIRGIHAEPWDKLIHVVSGQVFAAIVDLRADSPMFGHYQTFELNDHNILYVPKGLGNSYQSLTDSTYLYAVSGQWKPDAKYLMVSYRDPDLAIPWPKTSGQIVSEKDKSHPPMREVFPEWKK